MHRNSYGVPIEETGASRIAPRPEAGCLFPIRRRAKGNRRARSPPPVARTAVAGTATAVSNRVSRRRQRRVGPRKINMAPACQPVCPRPVAICSPSGGGFGGEALSAQVSPGPHGSDGAHAASPDGRPAGGCDQQALEEVAVLLGLSMRVTCAATGELDRVSRGPRRAAGNDGLRAVDSRQPAYPGRLSPARPPGASRTTVSPGRGSGVLPAVTGSRRPSRRTRNSRSLPGRTALPAGCPSTATPSSYLRENVGQVRSGPNRTSPPMNGATTPWLSAGALRRWTVPSTLPRRRTDTSALKSSSAVRKYTAP
jgi:hypothetical protein